MTTFQRAARGFNLLMQPLLGLPVLKDTLFKSMTEITYTGRRSGREITLPVAFQRRGTDQIVVGVAMPEQKSWWRNFAPGPEPIRIRLDGVDRTGTGVAKIGDKGTAVIITLDAPA